MATPAQIAARKKFAERARSGELAKMRKKNPAKKPTRATSRKANPVIPSANYDYALITEIKLTALNDADLYRQQGKPIIDNLAKKMVKGTFDAEKAVKLYQYLADNAVKKYSVEQFGKRTPTLTILSKPEREILAQHLFEEFAEEIQDTAEQMRSRKRNPMATRAPSRKRTQLVQNGERKKNPMAPAVKVSSDSMFKYAVEAKRMLGSAGSVFETIAAFHTKQQAQDYAKAILASNPTVTLRVKTYGGRAK